MAIGSRVDVADAAVGGSAGVAASSGVDVVTAIAVGGRSCAGGGTGVSVICGVVVVIAVGVRAGADVDVTAVGGRTGGGGGVDVNGSTVGELVVVSTSTLALSVALVWLSAVVLTSLQLLSEGVLVEVLVVASTSPRSGRERQRERERETERQRQGKNRSRIQQTVSLQPSVSLVFFQTRVPCHYVFSFMLLPPQAM